MTETLDTARAEAFGQRMLGALNDAALILLTSLGQRTDAVHVSVLHCMTVSLAREGAGLGTVWASRRLSRCSLLLVRRRRGEANRRRPLQQ